MKIQSWKLTNASATNVSLAPPIMDITALIREETQNFSNAMDEKLSKISETLKKISSTSESQSKCITSVDMRISDVQDTVAGLEVRLAKAEKKIKAMTDSMDDMENQSRQDNTRILNLELGMEGKCPIQFFESWLPTILSLEASPSTLKAVSRSTEHTEA